MVRNTHKFWVHRMTRSELRWLAGCAALVVALCEVPYLIAFGQVANGWHFVGMLWSPHDFVQYEAAMRQGATERSWLILDQLTSEIHQPALVYPFYVALGKLGGLLSLDLRAVYHLAEVGARTVLVCAAYGFSTLLFRSPSERRLSTLMVLFAAGLSIWFLMLAVGFRLDETNVLFSGDELRLPEVNTFLVMFTAPHLMLGLAVLMLIAVAYARALRGRTVEWSAVVGALVLLLAATNPFSLLTVCTVLSAHVAWTAIVQRGVPVRALSVWLAAMLAAAPLILYNLVLFGSDPLWGRTYGTQNILPPPSPGSAVIGYGALLALAAVGLKRFLPNPTAEQRLLISWIVLSAVMMYLPVSYGRRFAFGLHPMLALAATAGVLALWRRARGTDPIMPWRATLLRVGLTMLLVSTTSLSYGLFLRAVTKPSDKPELGGAFRPAGVHQAGVWLSRTMDPSDIVVADIQTSNYIGGMVPGRTYIGHWVATLGYREKERDVQRFFSAPDTHARASFLARSGARFVVWGPMERLMGEPPVDEALHPVFATDDVTIFEVAHSVMLATTRDVEATRK